MVVDITIDALTL
jgi:hypothetical protein